MRDTRRYAPRTRAALVAIAIALATSTSSCSLLLYVISREGSEGDLTLDQPVEGTTEDMRDDEQPSCATASAADAEWSFTAPANGLYTVHLDAAYDAVVAVYHDGDEARVQR